MAFCEHPQRGPDLLDGRVTESVIQQWAELVELGHPLYATLRQELNALCARFGKKPNALARISIIHGSNKRPPPASDDLVSLLATVFKSLSPAQFWSGADMNRKARLVG